MSTQVDCPVFRCPKISVARCAGHGRDCDTYYCRTHTKGTLCDRCAGLKAEEMKSGYRQMILDLWRKSVSAAWTPGVIVLLVISLLLVAAAVVLGVSAYRKGEGLIPYFVFALAGGGLGFFASFRWHLAKARAHMRSESIDLDLEYPGFYDCCLEWEKEYEDIITPSFPFFSGGRAGR